MKVLAIVCLLATLSSLVAGGQRVEGWIIPLSDIPINVVPWHPLGEFLVIHEKEFIEDNKSGLLDVEPIHTWVTVLDP